MNSISGLHKGNVIKINCEGILNFDSDRAVKDGFVYFGYNPFTDDLSIVKDKNIRLSNRKENDTLKLDYQIPIVSGLNHASIDESSM